MDVAVVKIILGIGATIIGMYALNAILEAFSP